MALLTKTIDAREETVACIRSTIAGAASMLRAQFDNACQLVWHNAYGLTPQQVLDALGTDAAELFAISNTIIPILNQAADAEHQITSVVPDGTTYTLNADGTITLGAA